MDRRKFIQASCAACLSATALAGLLTSCNTTRYVTGKLGTDGLFVNTDEFKIKKKDPMAIVLSSLSVMKRCSILFVSIASATPTTALYG